MIIALEACAFSPEKKRIDYKSKYAIIKIITLNLLEIYIYMCTHTHTHRSGF